MPRIRAGNRRYVVGPEKPKLRTKNVQQSRKSAATGMYWGTEAPKWPCWVCGGYGKIYDPADHDVYEGYKMATRHVKCKVCNGTGDVGKELFMKWHRERKTREKLSLIQWRRERRVAMELAKKLTCEEVAVLRSWRIEQR